MESQCLSLHEIPHVTKLHSLYLEDFKRVSEFYAHPPSVEGLLASSAQAAVDPATRAIVVATLRDQNRRFGPDPSVERNLDRLAGGAVAIVTGQQVGLFTGPAYSIYKAVTAICSARELTARGVDAVPVFWLAAEDHDFAEVDHCFWASREGLQRFALEADAASAGRPVGEIQLGQGIASLVEAAANALDGPDSQEIAAALRDAYSSGETFSSAFGKLLARLLRGRGLILLDPLDERFQSLASRVYQRAVAQNAQLIPEIIARDKALEAAGLHSQVRVGERSTLLFANVRGRRTPLRVKNGGFVAGDSAFTLEQLSEQLDKSPGLFSANVLLRPIVQDSLLPTAAYIAGPAETAYFAQASVVYRRLLGRMPVILLRAGFTLVEPAVARLLRKVHLDVRDVIRGRQHVRARLERESIPRDLARHFSTGDKNVRRYLARLRRPISRLDPTLAGALSTAERKILYQLDKLRGKAGRAVDFRSGLLDSREQLLRDALYPHHGLQERSHCLVPFLARHGAVLLDELERRALPVGEGAQPGLCHQVLFL